IADVYKKEALAAKTPLQKLALAKKLMADAEGTKSNPATKYTLLGQVSKMAAQIGHVELAIEATEAMAGEFDVNHAALVADALKEIVKVAKTPEQNFLILRWVDNSLTLRHPGDDYAASQRLAEFGLAAAKISKDREAIDEATRRGKE